eukprot:6181735-Pleurochrysis_carterae.AAC.2
MSQLAAETTHATHPRAHKRARSRYERAHSKPRRARAVGRARTLACSLHFWHETQSITRETLWNTPLNCFFNDHHGACARANMWQHSPKHAPSSQGQRLLGRALAKPSQPNPQWFLALPWAPSLLLFSEEERLVEGLEERAARPKHLRDKTAVREYGLDFRLKKAWP